ncbi:MAG: hypothetical protein IT521_03855 [Burkholderiales bacterium]|nr:hypothetical protein [Burkholderiales bacterium]
MINANFSLSGLPFVAGLLLTLCIAGNPVELRAAPPADVHGSLDAYAQPGLALAWGVLRGVDDAAATVVVRVDVDPNVYRTLAVTGVDPFTKASQTLVAPTPIKRTLLVRLPRARFADLPRTEWRFYSAAATAVKASDVPVLLVYYQGVPDTTPEFKDEAALAASLDQRIARARREMKSK